MTDGPDRKQQQRARYLQQAKKTRDPDEAKAIARHSRERKAKRAASTSHRPRSSDLEDTEHTEDFEKYRRGAKLEGLAESTERLRRAEALVAASTGSDGGGLVLEVGRAAAHVRLDGGRGEVDAELAPDLARVQRSTIAVGDRVGLERRDAETWRVATIEPRRTRLSRPDPTIAARERLVAANVDLGVIVLAAALPDPKLGLIDRMLVALGDGGVRAAVCVNKVDLLDPAQRENLEADLASYRSQTEGCVLTSTIGGEGVGDLRALMKGRTSVLLGPSGVGKSSLMNALVPGVERAVGDVREGDGKGRHTTTASRLIDLDEESQIIDTPGIRAFGLWAIPAGVLEAYIADLAAPGESCRFRNCIHDREPGCAVRAAVERGDFPEARHERYLRMRTEADLEV